MKLSAAHALASLCAALLVADVSGGSARQCVACPNRHCADYGYQTESGQVTEEDIENRKGLVDCICDRCSHTCGTGSASRMSLLDVWSAWETEAWYSNVAERFGTCDENGCSWADVCVPPWPQEPPPVGPFDAVINSLGHVVGYPKLATVHTRDCDEPFTISREEDGVVVLTGVTTPFTATTPDSEEFAFVPRSKACLVDFSAVDTPGAYRLQTYDGDSHNIQVGPNATAAFFRALKQAFASYYMARCGTATAELQDPDVVSVSTNRITNRVRPFRHEECHKEDGYVDFEHTGEEGEGERFRDGTGGWHDAGDYGKYSLNTAFAASVLLYAIEHFPETTAAVEIGGLPRALPEMPYVLEELKVGSQRL